MSQKTLKTELTANEATESRLITIELTTEECNRIDRLSERTELPFEKVVKCLLRNHLQFSMEEYSPTAVIADAAYDSAIYK